VLFFISYHFICIRIESSISKLKHDDDNGEEDVLFGYGDCCDPRYQGQKRSLENGHCELDPKDVQQRGRWSVQWFASHGIEQRIGEGHAGPRRHRSTLQNRRFAKSGKEEAGVEEEEVVFEKEDFVEKEEDGDKKEDCIEEEGVIEKEDVVVQEEEDWIEEEGADQKDNRFEEEIFIEKEDRIKEEINWMEIPIPLAKSLYLLFLHHICPSLLQPGVFQHRLCCTHLKRRVKILTVFRTHFELSLANWQREVAAWQRSQLYRLCRI
jgi:hypothetical protein